MQSNHYVVINNQNQTEQKMITCTKSIEDILKSIKNKFRVKAKTLFFVNGEIITNDNIDILNNCNTIHFSLADEFIGKIKHLELPRTNKTKIIGRDSLIEKEAINQLEYTAMLSGIKMAVGMPDLHVGRGIPVGAVFASQNFIWPHLIGNDIGCGIALFCVNKPKSSINIEKLYDKLDLDKKDHQMDVFGDFEFNNQFNNNEISSIGGGNHFAELQEVHEVKNQELFRELEMDENHYYLVVHSGSRGVGSEVLNRYKYVNKGYNKILIGSPNFDIYMADHNYAIEWAKLNRAGIADKFMRCLALPYRNKDKLIDVFHNFLESKIINGEEYWLHRKGAVVADKGYIVIPSSRGDYTYIVKPKAENIHESLYSLAHGAGRAHSRNDTYELAKSNPDYESKVEVLVKCESERLKLEEHPIGYKNIDDVIGSMIDHNLIDVVAIMKPILTYK